MLGKWYGRKTGSGTPDPTTWVPIKLGGPSRINEASKGFLSIYADVDKNKFEICKKL